MLYFANAHNKTKSIKFDLEGETVKTDLENIVKMVSR